MTVSRRALLRTGLAVTALPALGTPAVAEAGDPVIATCDEWGARQPSEPTTMLDRRPSFIVVHHTAGPNTDDTSREHAFELARSIQNFHMDARGWIDSGQQLTNTRGGHAVEGRRRSVEALINGHQHVLGANVADHNSEVIGIENEGTYTGVDVPVALWDSLVGLVTHIARRYEIPASEIRGHRDFNATECPGTVLYGRLPELRDAVGAQLSQPVVQPEVLPLLAPGDSGPLVAAAQHLLRDRGYPVAPDGVFGDRTATAARDFSAALPHDPCYACRAADERHLIGSSTWPALVRPTDPTDGSEAAKAAQLLSPARSTPGRLEISDWLRLLSR
ncbi:N-acetylmuramoyl-L-alanine amidase [Actinokineospora auranticolor]|uniref:N-acetylmuramoyl-L-alanine amidase n=1 Tax=Actinokineospora auranticolor TaxID=155976 RepID=A0A2S6GE20_9PSEU|nr:N-acetylmuramoyl-L-alanine amidase [Actinokineospora auranticolor]PPK63482.1 N-acetylmuramoyl-L-alanine amidase [Actinokineospora auranticolor]